jgi:hypothetical protein
VRKICDSSSCQSVCACRPTNNDRFPLCPFRASRALASIRLFSQTAHGI